MMEKMEHALIDVENNLADSLRRKLKTLQPLSQKRCIYRIPERFRQLNEGACTPRAVSIGPFHHGWEKVKAMEEYKLRYLLDFLQRTQVSIEDFLIYIRDREAELRECYAETIVFGSDDFVKMILMDAAFLIELLLSYSIGNEGNFAVSSESMEIDIWLDMWKLENQLPMFILKGLFELAISGMSANLCVRVSLCALSYNWFSSLGEFLMIEEALFEVHFSEAEHFLDLLRTCLQPPALEKEELQTEATLSITELEQAGVKFKLGSSKHLLDIKFKRGILEIPKLVVVESTEVLFRNLLAFEQLHCKENFYVNDFILILHHLFNTRKDVELLMEIGLLQSFLQDSEGTAALFHRLVRETVHVGSFHYFVLVKDLNAYCRIPWHKWKASLKQNHFNSPWASISVIAAAILLILTFIQTVCSVVSIS